MPYKITQLSDGMYQVTNSKTGKIHSSHTTLQNAEAQVRLLNGIKHGFIPAHVRTPSLIGQHTINHQKKVLSQHASAMIR